MGERAIGQADDVTRRVDTWLACGQVRIDADTTPIGLDGGVFEPQAFHLSGAPGRDQQHVALQGARGAVHGHDQLRSRADLLDRDPRDDLDAFIGQVAAQHVHQLGLGIGQQRRRDLDHRDRGAKAAHGLAEFERDRTSPDDQESLGEFAGLEQVVARPERDAVQPGDRRNGRGCPRGDNDARAGEFPAVHDDRLRSCERGVAINDLEAIQ